VIQFRTSVHFSSLDRNDFLTTTLIAFGIEHIQCAAIFETKDFPGLIIYVSLDCLNLLSNYSDQQQGGDTLRGACRYHSFAAAHDFETSPSLF
jgi:hypothetical protein